MPPEEGTGETEEECSAEFRPLVQLEEVERVSGEEGEATLIDLCAALSPHTPAQIPARLPGTGLHASHEHTHLA